MESSILGDLCVMNAVPDTRNHTEHPQETRKVGRMFHNRLLHFIPLFLFFKAFIWSTKIVSAWGTEGSVLKVKNR